MTIADILKLAILLGGIAFAVHGYLVPAPYGGDAGLVDAFDKMGSYFLAAVLFLIVIVWVVLDWLL